MVQPAGLKPSASGQGRTLPAFERAEVVETAKERAGHAAFAAVGGGPAGVAVAGAIAELARHAPACDFRTIKPFFARVIPAEARPRLLSTLSGKAVSPCGTDTAAAGVRAAHRCVRVRYRPLGALATIGGHAAVVRTGPVHVAGALAWRVWGLAHVHFLIGVHAPPQWPAAGLRAGDRR